MEINCDIIYTDRSTSFSATPLKEFAMNKLFATILFLLTLTACGASTASTRFTGNPQPRVHIQSQSKKDVYANYVFLKLDMNVDSARVSMCGIMHTTLTRTVDTVNVQLPARTCGTSAKVYVEVFNRGAKLGWAAMTYRTNYVNPAYYYGNPQLGCQYEDWIISDSTFKGKLPYDNCRN